MAKQDTKRTARTKPGRWQNGKAIFAIGKHGKAIFATGKHGNTETETKTDTKTKTNRSPFIKGERIRRPPKSEQAISRFYLNIIAF